MIFAGGYGTVYKARRKSDGVTFAIKCRNMSSLILPSQFLNTYDDESHLKGSFLKAHLLAYIYADFITYI